MAHDEIQEELGLETRAVAERLGIEPAVALELISAAERDRPVESVRIKQRGRLKRWMLRIGLIGLGVAGAGAAVVIAKPHLEELATDIVTESAEQVAHRELNERMGYVQEKSQEFLGILNGKLLPAMIHFMDVAKDKLSDPGQLMALAERLYEGLKEDAWSYYQSGLEDTNPDSLIAEIKKYISDDPDLNAAFAALEQVSQEVDQWIDALPEGLKRQAQFTEEDRVEALETIKEVTRTEVRKRWESWHPFTSAPQPESPESSAPLSSGEGRPE